MKNIPKLPLFLRIISNKIRNIFSVSKYLRGILYLGNVGLLKYLTGLSLKMKHKHYDVQDVQRLENKYSFNYIVFLTSNFLTIVPTTKNKNNIKINVYGIMVLRGPMPRTLVLYIYVKYLSGRLTG